jgi:hypothetical protein
MDELEIEWNETEPCLTRRKVGSQIVQFRKGPEVIAANCVGFHLGRCQHLFRYRLRRYSGYNRSPVEDRKLAEGDNRDRK